MLRLHRALVVAGAAALALAPLQPARADLATNYGIAVYPTQGQDDDQTRADEGRCYAAAQQQTGVDPTASPPLAAQVTPAQGGALKGALGGAALGALFGAIGGGNAGTGAAIGGGLGALFGLGAQRDANAQATAQAQAQAAAQYQQGIQAFRTSFSACLQASGYVARLQ
jgi:hypothetical protein